MQRASTCSGTIFVCTLAGVHAPAVAACCTLHNDKGDEADLLHNANAKVVAKRLPDLDTVAYPKLWKLAWLHCTAQARELRPQCAHSQLFLPAGRLQSRA